MRDYPRRLNDGHSNDARRIAAREPTGSSADRFEIDQLIRPMVNLYRITAGGLPVAFVRQKRMAIKEDIRFFADENETRGALPDQGARR